MLVIRCVDNEMNVTSHQFIGFNLPHSSHIVVFELCREAQWEIAFPGHMHMDYDHPDLHIKEISSLI